MVELKAWLDSRGIRSAGRPFILQYDNPLETPAAQLRAEVCLAASDSFENQGRYRMKEMPAGTFAETRHDGPPRSTRARTAPSSSPS